MEPSPEARAQARRHPNGWVYQIDGMFGSDDVVPPEAIVGAWKVDENGEIVGEFVPNPKYKPQNAKKKPWQFWKD
jgi:hypothetical protein